MGLLLYLIYRGLLIIYLLRKNRERTNQIPWFLPESPVKQVMGPCDSNISGYAATNDSWVTAMDGHGPGLCRRTKMESIGAVVVELLSIQ